MLEKKGKTLMLSPFRTPRFINMPVAAMMAMKMGKRHVYVQKTAFSRYLRGKNAYRGSTKIIKVVPRM